MSVLVAFIWFTVKNFNHHNFDLIQFTTVVC